MASKPVAYKVYCRFFAFVLACIIYFYLFYQYFWYFADKSGIKHRDLGKDSPRLNYSVFIPIRTSKKFIDSRLKVILQTWYQIAPANIFVVTDDHGCSKNKSAQYIHMCPSKNIITMNAFREDYCKDSNLTLGVIPF